MAEIYKSNAVLSNMSDINTTVKGGSYIGEKEKIVELPDSKDVTKRKKEIRLGTTFITRSEKEDSLRILAKAITSKKKGTLNAEEIKLISISLGSHLGEYIESMSGSGKYNELIANYSQAILIRTLLNFIETNSTL